MLRIFSKIVALAVLVIAGSIGIVYYRDHYSAEQQIAQLEQERKELQQFVSRLTSERRVAQILVTDQKQVNGVTQTTLMFQEFGRDGSALPPKSFTIEGNEAHIDAMVIKFDHDFVEQNDPLRGHSIALFTELFGRYQSPDKGFTIDPPGRIPDFYRDPNPQITAYESKLWQDFWKLADDASYRQQMGVRVAGGQGVWHRFQPGLLYTITLEADGGLNLVSSPIQGPYHDVLTHPNGV